jgi:hypothetical protein
MPKGDQIMWFAIGVAVGYFVAPMLLPKLTGGGSK